VRNIISPEIKVKRALRGFLNSLDIKRLELRKKVFFFLSGVLISVALTSYIRRFIEPLLYKIPLFKGQRWTLIAPFRKTVITPFLEEFAKAYPIMYRSDDKDRTLFTLGLLVGLGFGVAESIVYVSLGRASMVVRLLPTLFHAASTAIVAYGIMRDRPIRSYFAAVGLHSLHNLSLVLGITWIISTYPILLATFSIAVYLYRKTSLLSFPKFMYAPSQIDDYELTRNNWE
jgi:RsiW-degrading membrane proteinase PrsW (M82 family)